MVRVPSGTTIAKGGRVGRMFQGGYGWYRLEDSMEAESAKQNQSAWMVGLS